jgi:glycerol-3-phosphate O-acyltransferase
LLKILKHLWITKERQGKVVIKYCKPISLKLMLQNYTVQNKLHALTLYQSVNSEKATPDSVLLKKRFVNELEKEIAYTLSESQMVMSTSLLASVLLVERNKGMNEETLVKKISFVY